MRKPTLKGQGRREFLDRVVEKLNASSKAGGMRSEKKDAPEFDATRTTRSILSEVKYVIFTGNRCYDLITGGQPVGRMIEIYGTDTSGKTTLVKRSGLSASTLRDLPGCGVYERIITKDSDGFKHVSYKKLDPELYDVTVLYIDNEQSFDDDNSLVVEGRHVDFVLARCDTINQVFDAMEKVSNMAMEEEEDTGKMQFVVAIVDTIASTASDQELTQSWGGKEDYSRQPKQLKAGFRKMVRHINRAKVCMICVNQVSDTFVVHEKKNPNALPDESFFSTSGGRAIKFYASQRMMLQKAYYPFRLSKDSRSDDGLLIEVKTVKNRIRKPLRKFRMVLLFGGAEGEGGGYSDIYSMLETMIMAGTVNVESYRLSFRFSAYGVPLTTFPEKMPRGNPSCDNKLSFPAFYAEHKADVDVLFEKTVHQIFTSESSIQAEEGVGDDDEEIFGKGRKEEVE